MRSFQYRMPMRWGDMDAMGHINNTLYFRYFEQARISWFEAVGLSTDGRGCGPILAHVSCDFVRPLKYPGDILVDQVITRVGNSSVAMDLSIVRADAPTDLYARGKSVIVWMDYAAGRAIPWPDPVRRLMDGSGAPHS
jgi:acyl-CoA thioester hydrolase